MASRPTMKGVTHHPEREEAAPATPRPERGSAAAQADGCRLISVYDQAPEGYDGTCLRPLGLCELGGACDSCWYNSSRDASLKQRPNER